MHHGRSIDLCTSIMQAVTPRCPHPRPLSRKRARGARERLPFLHDRYLPGSSAAVGRLFQIVAGDGGLAECLLYARKQPRGTFTSALR